MTASSVLGSLGLDPASNDHAGRNAATTGGDTSLEGAVLQTSFEFELGKLQEYFSVNNAAYQNRRTQLRQNPTQLRIISEAGKDQLTSLGLRNRGRGAPVFCYFPPKTNDGIRPFRDGISFVVMHSFGRGYDKAQTERFHTRTVPIDPLTGHNPRRYANGMATLLSPGARSRAAIHHVVSLRGDLVNSVSWDNRCLHGGAGEGSGVNGVNDYSIGIEHEEWYLRTAPGASFREIEDHGPYTEEQFAIDAFILKKLQAYTGQDFTVYLGYGEQLRQNIANRVVGCFNHAWVYRLSTNPETLRHAHADPGGEFFLPPGYELRVTNLSSMLETQERTGAWQRRFDLWYRDVPNGTRISAYDRIFEKVRRLRSFNLQSEVFDPSIGGGRIQVAAPEIQGTYTSAAAQRAARDRITGVDRAERMQGVTRAGLYAAAQDTNSAVATAWAEHTSRLNDITQGSLRLPVIVNAIGFDYNSGTWVNATSRNEPSEAQAQEFFENHPGVTPNTDPTR